jgi:hypothetical protein
MPLSWFVAAEACFYFYTYLRQLHRIIYLVLVCNVFSHPLTLTSGNRAISNTQGSGKEGLTAAATGQHRRCRQLKLV